MEYKPNGEFRNEDPIEPTSMIKYEDLELNESTDSLTYVVK